MKRKKSTKLKLDAKTAQIIAELGRMGGKIGGPARAAAMTAAERSESARHAITSRWAKPGEYKRQSRALKAAWAKRRAEKAQETSK